MNLGLAKSLLRNRQWMLVRTDAEGAEVWCSPITGSVLTLPVHNDSQTGNRLRIALLSAYQEAPVEQIEDWVEQVLNDGPGGSAEDAASDDRQVIQSPNRLPEECVRR